MSRPVFTINQKTILSVDFDRKSTCMQTCSYCYVIGMENTYSKYIAKVARNSNFMKTVKGRLEFAKRLNEEYEKNRKSKSEKLRRLGSIPVRIYGGGDYIEEHLETLQKLNFKFYVISKNITNISMSHNIDKVLDIANMTNLVLSFDDQNMSNYTVLRNYFGQDRISFCYTGLPDHFKDWKDIGLKFDIFFNVKGKTNIEKEKTRAYKERCPAMSGEMKGYKACTRCSKCWRSSITKNPDWNSL